MALTANLLSDDLKNQLEDGPEEFGLTGLPAQTAGTANQVQTGMTAGTEVPTRTITPLPEEDPALQVPQTQRGGILSPGVTAPVAEVAPEATVRHQMGQLLSQGSPYLTAAREGAKRQAASRGLLNTTMAAGAGEQAAIQSALPIAQQDAALYGQYGLQNAQAATQLLLQQISTGAQLTIADLDAATRILGIQMDNDHQVMLTQMVEDNKRALQSDASISTAFSNTMNSIAGVYQNPEMYEVEKRAAAEYFMSSFRSYVEFQDVTGGSNYADQFDWGSWDTNEQGGGDGGGGTSTQEQAERREELIPFGVEGSTDGEVRTRQFPSGLSFDYRWDSKQDRWERINAER